MTMHLRKNSPLIKIINNDLIDLPSPTNISTLWNFGSLMGICLMIQIFTGIFLALHYCPDSYNAYNSVSHICRDINYGWLIRTIYANEASMFFICLYIHVGREWYSSSFELLGTWTMGVLTLMMTMATAFLGYVIPWGQMSFWGATVITYLMSAITYIGNSIVYWLWGGFAVDNATLLHFTLPFIISGMVLIHLMFLHKTWNLKSLMN